MTCTYSRSYSRTMVFRPWLGVCLSQKLAIVQSHALRQGPAPSLIHININNGKWIYFLTYGRLLEAFFWQ